MPSANYVSDSNYLVSDVFEPRKTMFGESLPTKNVDYWWSNATTGDIDYARQLESMGFQNIFNAEQAQIQRDYEERLANTSYQRAVKDLRAAGLNPYLAYGQGGADTPYGYASSSASGVAAKSGSIYAAILSALVGALGGVAGKAISSATSIATAKMRGDVYLEAQRYRQSKGGYTKGEQHNYSDKLFNSLINDPDEAMKRI